MKNFSLLLTLYFFSQATLLSQSPDTLWTKIYGGSDQDMPQFVQQTSDGGYILTGETKSFGTGLNDVWLIKTNSIGDTIWTRTFGRSEDDNCACVKQTSDGGYILFAETVFYSSDYWKVWLLKTSASGDTTWTNIIGGSRHYFAQSGQEISGGDYVFVGYTKATGAGQEDLWLVKTDATGDTIWTETYGGAENDISHSMQQTKDGGYIIAASTKSFGAGDYDGLLLKTDYEGDSLWAKTFGGTDTDHIVSVQQTSDNGFILAGTTRSFGNGYSDVWLIKTNAIGDTSWTKTFGTSGFEGASSVEQTMDGGYVISAYSPEGAWIIKTDSSGDTLWTKTIAGGSGKNIQQTSDGGYILLAQTYSNPTLNDYWLIKTAPDPSDVNPKDLNSIPETFILKQNFPNPFNPSTKIHYSVPNVISSGARNPFVKLEVFDVLGNKVATLVNEEKPAGEYEVNFYSNGLTSGVYFYQLQSGEFLETKKMLLIK